MLSARKITLVPPENSKVEQFGSGFENEESGSLTTLVEKSTDKIKSKIYDKIHRFIKVILKLARTIGYDDDLRIKLRSGKYLEKSNIVNLLTHAMSAGKVLYGEDEFIELLADSGVDPNLIINENVRNKLIQFTNKNKEFSTVTEKEVVSRNLKSTAANEMSDPRINVIRKGAKKFIVEKENEPKRKYKLIEVNKDGPTIELNPDDEMQSEKHSNKRKRVVLEDDDDSVDDDLIDDMKWKTN